MEFLKHFKALENGRRITVGAIFENGQMSFGLAVLKPGENFCKITGRNKALGRAKSRNAIVDNLVGIDNPKDYFITRSSELAFVKNNAIEDWVEEVKMKHQNRA